MVGSLKSFLREGNMTDLSGKLPGLFSEVHFRVGLGDEHGQNCQITEKSLLTPPISKAVMSFVLVEDLRLRNSTSAGCCKSEILFLINGYVANTFVQFPNIPRVKCIKTSHFVFLTY